MYDPRVRTAAGNRQRLRDRITSPLELARIACTVAELACLDGRHHTETEPDTGDEVCRRCGFNTTDQTERTEP